LTKEETTFYIDQVFLAKERLQTIAYRDSFIVAKNHETIALRKEIREKDQVLSYKDLQVSNCVSDKKYLTEQLSTANSKVINLKRGLNLTIGVAAVLGILAIVR